MAKASKSAVIVKKKVWLQIIAPALFNNQPIGDIYVEEPEQAIGRRITVSLMTLTGDPQRQNIHISFKIAKAENKQLLTQIVGYSIIPVAVRKMMRRGRDRIEDSFVTKTQDGVAVRIKPVLITRNHTKGSILTDLRQHLRANILRTVAKLSFQDFYKELIAHNFQRQLHQALNKIYPLQTCEIRDLFIETSEKGLKKIISAPAVAETKPVAEATEQPPAEEAA